MQAGAADGSRRVAKWALAALVVVFVVSGSAGEAAASGGPPHRVELPAGEDSAPLDAIAPDGMLRPGDSLSAGESITSPKGWYRLVLQHDGNLVLQATADSNVLWESGTLGWARGVVMESDGNLVLYEHPATRFHLLWFSRIYGVPPPRLAATARRGSATRHQYRPVLWQSGTQDSPGAFLTVGDDGTVKIGDEDGRVVWRVGEPAPDVGLAETNHVVYGVSAQRVWLVEADGSLLDTYPVSGMAGTPGAGRYEVFSKSVQAWSFTPGISMKHMIRFAIGAEGNAIGFHSIPVNDRGTPVQTEDELGQYRSAGCVRQRVDKAAQFYEWAPVGTPVVVVA